MNYRNVVILVFVVMAFTGGFYLALALQKQIEALIGAAIILAFLTWIGSGTDILGLLREWYKEKQDQKKVPVLEPSETKRDSLNNYYLKLIVVAGEGLVNRCHGFIDVESQEDLKHFPLYWRGNDHTRHLSIGIEEYLQLFQIVEYDEKRKVLVFNNWTYDKSRQEETYVPIKKPLDELQQRQIKVKITADNGKFPKEYTRTIAQIIDESTNLT